MKNLENYTSIKKGDIICSVDSLEDKKALVIEKKGKYLPGIIVYKEKDIITAWVNSCPHANLPLDLIRGKVQSNDGKLLCANHGAKFDPKAGICIKGPCKEKHLISFPFIIENNNLIAGN